MQLIIPGMSVILAIETSTPAGEVALAQDGQLLFYVDFRSERNHNSALFPALQEALAHPAAAELGRILVGTGPGSYNGCRIAIAAAQGIATVRGAMVTGLSSFYGLEGRDSDGVACICGDARRAEFYTQRFENGALAPEPTLHQKEAFLSQLEKDRADGIPILSTDEPARLDFAGPITFGTPSARALIRSWLALPPSEATRLQQIAPEPAYLRPPHITKAKPRARSQFRA